MTKFASDLFAQSHKTREKLTSMIMQGKGWDTGTLHGESLGEPQTYIYTKDIGTGWIWMCSMPRSAFGTISRTASRASDKEIQAIRGATGDLIRQLAAGRIPQIRESLTGEEQLALMLASYMGTTQCWQLADQLKSKGSAIVMHYRSASQPNEGMLRPGVVPASQVLEAETALKYFQDIEALDRDRHPEWFR